MQLHKMVWSLCVNVGSPSSTVNLFLQSNALVNMANLQGNTALHEAVRGGHQALVELLLKSGASPGLRNKRQRTPLDCAYELGGKVLPKNIVEGQGSQGRLQDYLRLKKKYISFHQ